MEVRKTDHSSIPKAPESTKSKKGMVLPFRPLSLAFQDVNYYIDMPLVTSNSLILYHFNIFFDFCIFLAMPNSFFPCTHHDSITSSSVCVCVNETIDTKSQNFALTPANSFL